MNSKLREQGKREEKRRLKEFVENAYRCDPRVIAHKEAQRAERWAACAPLLASIMQALGFGFLRYQALHTMHKHAIPQTHVLP